VFIPLAGFSPSCWVVFVQIEHCADEGSVLNNEKQKMRNAIKRLFFITPYFYKVSIDINTKFLFLLSKG